MLITSNIYYEESFMKTYIFESKDFGIREKLVYEFKEDLYDLNNEKREINSKLSLSQMDVYDKMNLGVDILIPYNDDFIFTYSNGKTWQRLNIKADDLICKSFKDTFPFLIDLGLFKIFSSIYNEHNSFEINIKVFEENKVIFSTKVSGFREGQFIYMFSEVLTNVDLLEYQKEENAKLISDLEHIQEFSKTAIYYFDGIQRFWPNEIYDILEIEPEENDKNFNIIESRTNMLESSEAKRELLHINDELSKLSSDNPIIEFETWVITKNNTKKYLKIYLKAKYKKGKFYSQYGFIKDITNLKSEKHKIRDLNENLTLKERRNNNLNDTLLKISAMSKIAYGSWTKEEGYVWSSNFFKMLNLEKNDYSNDVDIILKFLDDDYKEYITKKLNEARIGDRYFDETIKIKTKLGNIKYFNALAYFYLDDEDVTFAYLFIQDITENKQVEDRLHSLLKDKEVLLREVHHRVKNNLQIILSLLNLELRYHYDSPYDIITKSKERVYMMALVYEGVYQSFDLNHVNANDYIVKGMNGLFKLYSKGDIKGNYDIAQVNIDLEKSISLGLILNELAFNTMNHGFPNEEFGNFNVDLTTDEDKIMVNVYDDGVGLSEDINIYSSENLGFTIINNLVNQIGGKLSVLDRDSGFGVKIEFENKPMFTKENRI